MKNSLKPTHRILLNANPTHGYMVCSRYIENKTPVWRIEIIKRDKTSLRSFKGLWLEIVGNNTTPVALGGSAAEKVFKKIQDTATPFFAPYKGND